MTDLITVEGGPERVRFAAQVVHLGRAFGVVRVTAHNDGGKPFAIATVTMSP